MSEKVKTALEIKEISEKLRSQGKTIVTTNGAFDILHLAHVKTLERAKKEGDFLMVLLNSDRSIRNYKGEGRPIIPEQERAEMLAALGCVDYVIIFDEDMPLGILDTIKPKIHVKGGTFVEERIRKEKELLEKWGGVFKNFEVEDGFSTTNIINRVLEKNGFREYKK